MGQTSDLQDTRRRLGLALNAIRHDRWLLGYLQGGCMQPIATSEISRRLLEGRALMPLARRALYERRPIVVNSVMDVDDASAEYDWELDWPAILYAPVGDLGHRPIGLLVVACRGEHWYTETDIAYAHTLGVSLAPMVSALRTRLSRLTAREMLAAQLLSHGFSSPEISRAIGIDEANARMLVDRVSRKLRSLTENDLRFPAIQLSRMTW